MTTGGGWPVWQSRLLPVAAMIGLLVVWQGVIVLYQVPSFIASTPTAVLARIADEAGNLLFNLGITASEAISGFGIGNLIAAALAVAFVYRPTLQEAIMPVAVAFNTIPVVVKAPILILLMGHGMAPKITITALLCFFPMLVNMTRGLREVVPEHLELMHILSASPREVFVKVRLQNAIPYAFVALKVTATTSVIAAILAEWIGATNGLGAIIIRSTINYDTPMLYATIVVGSLFSSLFFFVVSRIEKNLLKWKVEID